MKTINALIPYNLCQIISIIYSLNILELNELNPSKHLPNVLIICFSFQFIALLITHSIISNNNQVF